MTLMSKSFLANPHFWCRCRCRIQTWRRWEWSWTCR